MSSIRTKWLTGVVATLVMAGCNCGGVSIKSLELTPDSPSIQRGKTVQLTATVTLSDNTTKDVTELGNWTSADENIATVSNSVGSKGLVTAKGVGTVKITANYAQKEGDPGVDATTNVTVTAPPRGTVIVMPPTGLTTTEAGGTATFTIALSSKPEADVVIALASNNIQEGTVSPASITLTGANFAAPQTVTVTGVDDQIADGPVAYKILTAPAVSTDPAYSAVEAADVDVTNTDNDTAGITVTPNTGLVTSESGQTATFTVVLNSKPTGDVTIALTSSNTAEGTVAPAVLTFTGMSWNAPQMVTVTGADDMASDGDKMYVIATAAAVSTDTGYNGVDADDVAVTNTDNDTAGITVTAAANLQTSEASNGPTATFSVKLNTKPSDNVIIAISSSNTAEGTASPAALTFTEINWAAPQSVTATGVDDMVADGNQNYNIVTAPAVSADTRYNGINAADVPVTNIDNDSAGFTVTPLTISVSESGTTATFTIKPNTQPTADVIIAISSSNTAEATVTPAAITFTTLNWGSARTVTANGVDDSIADGDQVFTIVTGAAVSTDTRYSGLAVPDVSGTNVDNDTAGFTVTPVAGLTTTEDPNASGHTATFTVKLNTQPTAGVTVSFISSNIQEGTISPASISFTTANWNAPQTVTVTGVDDQSIDGDQMFTIAGLPAVSTDSRYNGLAPHLVTATNRDNDSSGFVFTSITGPTTEGGGTATFTVKLTTQPASPVIMPFSSNNTAEGTVFPAALTFNTTNWAAGQLVTVTGVNDNVADGDIVYQILVGTTQSADQNYNGKNNASISVTNLDNDSPDFVINTTTLVTSENDGMTPSVSFVVKLQSQPTADVSFTLASNNANEGVVTTASSLTFTSLNWNAGQTVRVRGVDDSLQDGPQLYAIVFSAAVSTDVRYNGLIPRRVDLANTDNDTAGYSVSLITIRPSLTTREASGAGRTDRFTVTLNSQPSSTVILPLSSSLPSEGTVTPALTFTTTDWNSPHTATVTGVDDSVADGDISYFINFGIATGNAQYGALTPPASIAATNIDNDSPGFVVTAVNPSTIPLATSETGTIARFNVSLQSQPTATVILPVSSSNSAEAALNVSNLTFTTTDWAGAHTVAVTGQQDAIQDGAQSFQVIFGLATSSDSNYSGTKPASDVAGTNADDDTAGVNVVPSSGLTTNEGGGTDTINLTLATQPTATVIIAVSSSRPAEATTNVTSLTFTTSNWGSPHPVIVTGQDDSVQDGAQNFSINFGTPSGDANYAAISIPSVSGQNADNDSAGVTFEQIATAQTSEADNQMSNGTQMFTAKLNSQPTQPVYINVTSSDTTEGVVTVGGSLTFTSSNWSAAQTVSVRGVDDNLIDGQITYAIDFSNTVSADSTYNGLAGRSYNVDNIDNDSSSILVSPTEVTVGESNTFPQDHFTVVLSTQPTADVIVPVVSTRTAEATVSGERGLPMTFTAANWNAPQTVTVTGVDDAVADGQQDFTITVGAASSSDNNYNGLSGQTVGVHNVDNDSAGINVTPTSGLSTDENGGTATFLVQLNSQPASDVFIQLASSNASEGVVGINNSQVLTFTTTNWASFQPVVVTGINDNNIDGNVGYNINGSVVNTADMAYAASSVASVSLLNIDNDTAGISVNPSSTLRTSEGGGTASFRVRLNSRPNADVFIHFSSSDTTEGTAVKLGGGGDPQTLTFTTSNWNANQQVIITGVDDSLEDGNQVYHIIIDPAVSADNGFNGYDGLDAFDPTVINDDNDTAGITVNPRFGSLTLTTSELNAGSADFTVVLNTQPTSAVTIGISSNNTSEGTVSTSLLTFDALNWDSPQTVTVYGVDDQIQDGDRSYRALTAAAVSSDVKYNGLDADDVALLNLDNDTAGITVYQDFGCGGCSSNETNEAGTLTFQFGVALDTQPTSPVYVTFTTDRPGEASFSPTSLTFSTTNWASQQSVTVTGVDDFVQDGNQDFTIITNPASSLDQNYNNLNPVDVYGLNIDNDQAGVSVSAPNQLTTREDGTSTMNNTFTVVLNSQPTADVFIGISSDDTAEGTVDKATLTFTASNWQAPQTVSLSGVDDNIQDGDAQYSIDFATVVSGDNNYDGINTASLDALNIDNDQAGVTVTSPMNMFTTEAMGPNHTATYSIRLNSQPVSPVYISVGSTDTTEATTSPAVLTFDSLNWNAEHDVTVTGVDDAVQDGDITYALVNSNAVSADPNYNGMSVPNVNNVVNNDNDTAGIIVLLANNTVPSSTNRLTTNETGALQPIFNVSLQSQPTAPVTITFSVSDIGEGNRSPSVLSFDSMNWNSVQSVMVSGVDDQVQDGDQQYTVTGSASSGDPLYSGASVDTVYVTNLDDDQAGILVLDNSPMHALLGNTRQDTFEQDGGAYYVVELSSQPTDTVFMDVTVSDSTEGMVSPTVLTFTTANWNSPHTVQVWGVDDLVADGNINYSVGLTAHSNDGNYDGLNGADALFQNIDNDSAGVSYSLGEPGQTGEDLSTNDIFVHLNSQPTATVIIPVSSSDTTEGTVSAAQLTFTTSNWSIEQTLTVTGVNDNVADGNISYSVDFANGISSDSNYNGHFSDQEFLLNIDNDTAGYLISPASGTTVQEVPSSSQAVVGFHLRSQPTAQVVISWTSTDSGEAYVGNMGNGYTQTMTFTTSNWQTDQFVLIHGGIDDMLADGDQDVFIHGTPASMDPKYDSVSGAVNATISVTCQDNGTQGP